MKKNKQTYRDTNTRSRACLNSLFTSLTPPHPRRDSPSCPGTISWPRTNRDSSGSASPVLGLECHHSQARSHFLGLFKTRLHLGGPQESSSHMTSLNLSSSLVKRCNHGTSLFFLCLETGPHFVAQAVLELEAAPASAP